MGRTSAQQKLGSRIRSLRLSLGYSQEKLGEIAGLDRTYISGVERGVRNPSLKTIDKIAKALKIKTTDFF